MRSRASRATASNNCCNRRLAWMVDGMGSGGRRSLHRFHYLGLPRVVLVLAALALLALGKNGKSRCCLGLTVLVGRSVIGDARLENPARNGGRSRRCACACVEVPRKEGDGE